MNIDAIKENILHAGEIKPVGETFTLGGTTYHIMGMTLQPDGVLRLLILEYDEKYPNGEERAELEELSGAQNEPATNRHVQRKAFRNEPLLRFLGAAKVCFDGQEFGVSGGSSHICSVNQWETVVLFTRFLVSGWNPSGIDIQDLECIYRTEIEFEGKYSSVPDFGASGTVRFSMRPVSKCYGAEIPVLLTIGGEYNEKLLFFDSDTGRERWLQINTVYLFDMREHLEKVSTDPRVKELVPAAEIEKEKARLEAVLADECPEGMCFIAVDYECEDAMSVQFYSTHWLNTEPTRKGRFFSMCGFYRESERPVGKSGKKLKTAIISEPFPRDTKVIEAELFRYHIATAGGEITV